MCMQTIAWLTCMQPSVNALSEHGLTMSFAGTVECKAQQPGQELPQQARGGTKVLVDTGASNCYISGQLVQKLGLRITPSVRTLTLANGSQATATGSCRFVIQIGAYSATVHAYVLRLNTSFDVILGEDWCKANGVYNLYTQNCLTIAHSTMDGTSHRLTCNSEGVSALCPIVSAIHLESQLSSGDKLFLVNVNAMTSEKPDVTQIGVANSSADAKLAEILKEYKDVFPVELPSELPPERTVFHTIPLKEGAVPPPRKMYRLSGPEKREVERQVDALLEKGFIQPSCSPHGSPVIFVAKTDGTLRMCIEFRGLNSMTIKNRFPLPRIDDLFDQLQGAQLFSSMDLQSAYYQVRLKPEDVPKTAFTTPRGLYEYTVLCFGLTNAPSTFQAVMNDVLKEVSGKFVLVYLDDIVIYSKNAEEHVEHIRIVLEVLRKHKLYAKLPKCSFMQSELKFMGHIVGAQGLQVDPKKVAIVQDWPVPAGVAQLRSFLGLANYFRKFVTGWAALIAPLQKLTCKDESFVWSAECSEAFEGVKTALTNARVLALPDLNNPFVVICDACGVGLGAVLVQGGRLIAFEGKRLSEAEQKYTAGEQELLAVVHALQLWRCYLDGVEFTVVIS